MPGLPRREPVLRSGARKSQIIMTVGKRLLNSVMNALPLPEMHIHLPKGMQSEAVPNGFFQNSGKYSYCGPFTKLDKWLSQGYHGVNQLDYACLKHDVAYTTTTSTRILQVAMWLMMYLLLQC